MRNENNVWPSISGYFSPMEEQSVICLDEQEPLVKRLKETFPNALEEILAKAIAISHETNNRCLVSFMTRPSSSELARVITSSSYHIDGNTSVLMENHHFSVVLDNGAALEGEKANSCTILDDGTTAYVVNVFLDN